jgi:hypothetical protein
MAMIDFSVMLYDPAFDVIGVPATLTAAGTEIALTVIDDTRPKSNIDGTMEVRTIGPGAFARVPELAAKGIVRDDYQGVTLTFNGRNWVVRSHEMRGSPNGEDLGEVRFLLKAIESTNG